MNISLIPHLIAHCEEAVLAAEGFLAAAKDSVARLVTDDGGGPRAALDRHQRAAHALAWHATYVEALRQMARWARRLEHERRLGEIEKLILQAAFGEYLAQIVGGIPMSQNEIVRPYDMGLNDSDIGGFWTPTVKELGLPQATVTVWYGMFAPPGTPAPVLDRLRRELAAIAQSPEVRDKLAAAGLQLTPLMGDAFEKAVVDEYNQWKSIIAAEGIVAEE